MLRVRCMRGAYFQSGRQAAAAIAALALATASAAPLAAEPEPQYGWREVWAGADVSSHVWLLYSGATVAPFGHVYAEGWRLRAAGGYGQYAYMGTRRGELVTFNARTSYGEALVGYQKQWGPLTAKAFVGIAVVEHDVEPLDPENPVQGQTVGPKLATELWLNVDRATWASLDLSWTSAHGTAAARTRGGYRIFADVSLGIEGAINANDLGEDARAGLFVRHAWQGGEVSLACGLSGRFLEEAQSLRDPYATVNWLAQF